MQLTTKDSHYAVLDGVLEDAAFAEFCSYFYNMDFAYRSMTGWQKVWKISDGQILAGAPYYHSKAPFGCHMDILHQTILTLAETHLKDVVGEKDKDWDDFFLTPYIYPVGTKISWHNDTGYVAAAIFYTHKVWSPNWGGELMIARLKSGLVATQEEMTVQAHTYDNMTRSHLNPILDHYSMGHYIAPKPNRLVFTKTGVWHSINRVDAAAGESARCSIVAFFTKGNQDAVH